MEDIRKQVGNRIRALRIKKGLTQEELARKSGLNRSHMGEVEGGGNVTIGTLERVAAGLEVSVEEVMTRMRVSQRQKKP